MGYTKIAQQMLQIVLCKI